MHKFRLETKSSHATDSEMHMYMVYFQGSVVHFRVRPLPASCPSSHYERYAVIHSQIHLNMQLCKSQWYFSFLRAFGVRFKPFKILMLAFKIETLTMLCFYGCIHVQQMYIHTHTHICAFKYTSSCLLCTTNVSIY